MRSRTLPLRIAGDRAGRRGSRRLWAWGLALTCLASSPVLAASTPEPPSNPWSETMELSFVDTGGNTEVTTLSFKSTLQYRFTERAFGTWKLGAVFGRSAGETNAESYQTELRGDYAVTKRTYWLGYGSWLRDTFSGIDSRTSLGTGPGYRFLVGPRHTLRGEIGLSYSEEDSSDGAEKEYFGGRVFGTYEYRFGEKSTISQAVEFQLDFSETDDWLLNSETALTLPLSSALALRTSYTLKHDNRPVADLKKTDTVLSIALQISF